MGALWQPSWKSSFFSLIIRDGYSRQWLCSSLARSLDVECWRFYLHRELFLKGLLFHLVKVFCSFSVTVSDGFRNGPFYLAEKTNVDRHGKLSHIQDSCFACQNHHRKIEQSYLPRPSLTNIQLQTLRNAHSFRGAKWRWGCCALQNSLKLSELSGSLKQETLSWGPWLGLLADLAGFAILS